MTRSTPPRALAVAIAAVLALPAAAIAAPSVATDQQLFDTGGITYPTDPAGLLARTRYVATNDGYVAGFSETNGADATKGGVLDYDVLPPAYRATATPDQKRTYAAAQTALQAHATCEDVPALDPTTPSGGANVLAWQGSDPGYDYVPWQTKGLTLAGAPKGAEANLLGEDPSKWIPVVKAATDGLAGAPAGGVDLSKLTTTQQLTDACAALGGTYRAADTASDVASKYVALALAPLQAQITSLTTQVTKLTDDNKKLTTDKKAVDTKLAATEAARLALINRTLTVSLAKLRFTPREGATALVTGVVGDEVVVRLRRAGKGRAVLAREKTNIQSEGAVLSNLVISASAQRELAKGRGPLAVDVEVTTTGRDGKTSTPGTIVR